MPSDDRQLHLPEREAEILALWERERIFEATLEKTKRGAPFVFYEGPPTANGNPGIHHFEARVFKDLIPRYQTMRGCFVARKAGWDTHGLPVELQVEKELGLKSKRDIERYGIARFNAKCRESVWRYKEEWDRFTRRIGFWLDLEHPYITYETSYIESLWWVISEFWKKKLLNKDFKVVPWCTRCQTALSTHELGLGYKTVTDRSIYVRFRLQDGQKIGATPIPPATSIIAWTTTPWTLPGNVALAVGNEIEYALVKRVKTSEYFIVAADRVASLNVAGSVLRRICGRDLVGLRYEPLFLIQDLQNEKSHRIYAADFVSTEEGTGVVHTAVMYGDDDYQLGKSVGLPMTHTVDETGHFERNIPEGLAGKYVKDPGTEDAIIQSLVRRGFLFAEEKHEHEYPFCWRCDTPLLYYARSAWWVRMTSLKKELVANNEKINWVPNHIKRGRFGEFLREVRDWAFSRERYWGTPIPIWECIQCTHQEVAGSLADLDRLDPAPTKVTFMRHGEALHNLNNFVNPVSDVHDQNDILTPAGRASAAAAAQKLRRAGITAVLASPSRRAQDTARIVADILGIKRVETVAALSDFKAGGFEGRPVEEYRAAFSDFLERFWKNPEGSENLREMRARMVGAVLEIKKKHPEQHVLVVSHGDPTWVAMAALEGFPEPAYETAAYLSPGGFRTIRLHNWPYDESGAVNLHRPYVDAIRLRCLKCNGDMRRVPEVADVWFDSGAMPFAQHHYPFARKRNLPFPADYICEAVDQTRGWFYTLHAVSTALGRGNAYRNVISLGHVLDKNGQKMSKSKGNVVNPWDMISKYGTDAIRWYFYTVNAPGDPKNFDERDLAMKLRGPLATFWNSFVFFDTYVKKIKQQKQKTRSRHVLDRWIAVKIELLTEDVTNRLDRYDIVGAARAIESFLVDDFSNWYLRRSRRRFQKPERASEKDDAAQMTASTLLRLTELMAPFTPFLAEIIYQELRKKVWLRERSVHLRDWPAARIKKQRSSTGRRGERIVEEMELVRKFAALTLAERAKAGIKVRQPLRLLKIKSQDTGISDELLRVLKDEVNVKMVSFDPSISSDVELDITITPELADEGFVREVVRNIQEMRRDGGFSPRDKITLALVAAPRQIAVIERWRKFIQAEAGVHEITTGGKFNAAVEREVPYAGGQIILSIAKR